MVRVCEQIKYPYSISTISNFLAELASTYRRRRVMQWLQIQTEVKIMIHVITWYEGGLSTFVLFSNPCADISAETN